MLPSKVQRQAVLFCHPVLFRAIPIALSQDRILDTINNRELPLSWLRLIICTRQDKSVFVMVILALSEASWGIDHVESWVYNQRDEKPRKKTEPAELHQIVWHAIDVGAAKDVTGKRRCYGEEEGQESAPVISGETVLNSSPIGIRGCEMMLTRLHTSRYSLRFQCTGHAS